MGKQFDTSMLKAEQTYLNLEAGWEEEEEDRPDSGKSKKDPKVKYGVGNWLPGAKTLGKIGGAMKRFDDFSKRALQSVQDHGVAAPLVALGKSQLMDVKGRTPGDEGYLGPPSGADPDTLRKYQGRIFTTQYISSISWGSLSKQGRNAIKNNRRGFELLKGWLYDIDNKHIDEVDFRELPTSATINIKKDSGLKKSRKSNRLTDTGDEDSIALGSGDEGYSTHRNVNIKKLFGNSSDQWELFKRSFTKQRY